MMLNVVHVADTLIRQLEAHRPSPAPNPASTPSPNQPEPAEAAVDWHSMLSLLRTVRAEAASGFQVRVRVRVRVRVSVRVGFPAGTLPVTKVRVS